MRAANDSPPPGGGRVGGGCRCRSKNSRKEEHPIAGSWLLPLRRCFILVSDLVYDPRRTRFAHREPRRSSQRHPPPTPPPQGGGVTISPRLRFDLRLYSVRYVSPIAIHDNSGVLIEAWSIAEIPKRLCHLFHLFYQVQIRLGSPRSSPGCFCSQITAIAPPRPPTWRPASALSRSS